MRVVWALGALRELDDILRYIEQSNPAAAARVVADLVTLGDSLAVFPHRGRPVRDGARELVSRWPYIIRYEVAGDTVSVLRVRHAARRPD